MSNCCSECCSVCALLQHVATVAAFQCYAPRCWRTEASSATTCYRVAVRAATLQYMMRCHEPRRWQKDASGDNTNQIVEEHVAVYTCVAVYVLRSHDPRRAREIASSDTTHQSVAVRVAVHICVAVCVAMPQIETCAGNRVERHYTSKCCSACCSVYVCCSMRYGATNQRVCGMTR